MTHQEYSSAIMATGGSNIFDLEGWEYTSLFKKLGRRPVLTDFQPWQQTQYAQYLAAFELKKLILDGHNSVHVRFNHGARAGSIALVTNQDQFYGDQDDSYDRAKVTYYPKSKIDLLWDEGKTWSFVLGRHMDLEVIRKSGGTHHDILINYTGPTVTKFEKTARPARAPAAVFDAYERRIDVDSWIIDKRFRIGQVKRISPAGTIWVQFIGHKLFFRYKTEPLEQMNSASGEVLLMDVPEEFATTAKFLDNDLNGFDLNTSLSFKEE